MSYINHCKEEDSANKCIDELNKKLNLTLSHVNGTNTRDEVLNAWFNSDRAIKESKEINQKDLFVPYPLLWVD